MGLASRCRLGAGGRPGSSQAQGVGENPGEGLLSGWGWGVRFFREGHLTEPPPSRLRGAPAGSDSPGPKEAGARGWHAPGPEASPGTHCWTPASPGAGQVLTRPPRERLVPSHEILEPLSSSTGLRAGPSPPQDTPWPGSQQARGCPSALHSRPLWGGRGGPCWPESSCSDRAAPPLDRPGGSAPVPARSRCVSGWSEGRLTDGWG